MVINTDHELSISRDPAAPQPPTHGLPLSAGGLLGALILGAWAAPALAGGPSCTSALGAPIATQGPLRIGGGEPAAARVAVVPGHTYLIQVEERDKDAFIEVLDPTSEIVARADHPERRTGTRRAVLVAGSSSLLVRVTQKEQISGRGSAEVQVFDLAALHAHPDCLIALNALARGDADYTVGQQISSGHSNSSGGSAHEAFLRAAQAYASAEDAFHASGDTRLRGETALALAGLRYFDLQDWTGAADQAQAAAGLLAAHDPYRKARSEALLAASWIEIGSSAPAGRAAPGSGANANGLLVRARREFQRLLQLHLQRGERYDAGLQLTNIGLTYLNEGRYLECVKASAAASGLFGSMHEIQRRALASQNEALCLWGLGQLPEALRRFEQALADIGPEPYPRMYLAVITNTALADFALGHLDESLRLYDRALAFAQKVQYPRDEAYCLYGIGVNYYALGDRARAREFLERSLAIRTVALDGRGRMASLRALATIDAEQGRVEQALAYDREALGLAVAPSAIARITIQQAVHTAAAGRYTEAEALLDEVLSKAPSTPLIQAEAHLQRAVLRRSTGRPEEALADLAAARPDLHRFGSIVEEFEADLELARTQRDLGKPDAALVAVERALAQSDAVRLQSANPELRAQLQTPLRPAYDLKLELLRERYERATAAGRDRDANTLAAAAFATADASRARSFADVAAQRYSATVRRKLAAEFHHREELYRELAARRFALDARLERSGADDPRVRHLVADITDLGRQLDTVNTVIAQATSQPDSAAGKSGKPRITVPAVGPDTALVSYWLGSESAYAWAVLPGEIHWVRLSSPAAIAKEAAAFHRSLTRLVDVPVERRLENGLTLYKSILGPVEPWLSGVRTWLVIPDGALDYVPFAALRRADASESFVLLQHDIAVTPAAWMLDSSRTAAPLQGRGKLLLVADPVYQADDPRLGSVKYSPAAEKGSTDWAPDRGQQDHSRLRFTGEEAAAIAAQFPHAQVDELTGVDATRDRLLALDWSQYRFIHIATHGVVDAQVPQLSSLILGSYDAHGQVADRAVRVADVALQTLNAEVAVLSACETALGTQVRSEGLIGMSSTLLARGARAVVASLWPVPDEVSAHLMTEFYRHMLRDAMGPERALGAAMRSATSREASADPALWAAFQVSIADVRSPARAAAQTPQIATATRP